MQGTISLASLELYSEIKPEQYTKIRKLFSSRKNVATNLQEYFNAISGLCPIKSNFEDLCHFENSFSFWETES